MNSSNQYWYLFTSDGKQACLIDFYKKPPVAELKLALFKKGKDPFLLKEIYPLSKFSKIKKNLKIGPMTLTPQSCKGTFRQNKINLRLKKPSHQMDFVPNFIKPFAGIIPTICLLKSHYGTLNGKIGAHTFKNSPYVLSGYQIKNLAKAHWVLLSALHFKGSDLKIEFAGTKLIGGLWGHSAFVTYNKKNYVLNNPLVTMRKIKGGAISKKNHYELSGCIKLPDAKVSFKSKIPFKDCAMLGEEGSTKIFNCGLTDVAVRIKQKDKTKTFHSESTSMFEFKI